MEKTVVIFTAEGSLWAKRHEESARARYPTAKLHTVADLEALGIYLEENRDNVIKVNWAGSFIDVIDAFKLCHELEIRPAAE